MSPLRSACASAAHGGASRPVASLWSQSAAVCSGVPPVVLRAAADAPAAQSDESGPAHLGRKVQRGRRAKAVRGRRVGAAREQRRRRTLVAIAAAIISGVAPERPTASECAPASSSSATAAAWPAAAPRAARWCRRRRPPSTSGTSSMSRRNASRSPRAAAAWSGAPSTAAGHDREGDEKRALSTTPCSPPGNGAASPALSSVLGAGAFASVRPAWLGATTTAHACATCLCSARRRDCGVAPLVRELELERRRLAAVADGDRLTLVNLATPRSARALTRRVLQRGERKHRGAASASSAVARVCRCDGTTQRPESET